MKLSQRIDNYLQNQQRAFKATKKKLDKQKRRLEATETKFQRLKEDVACLEQEYCVLKHDIETVETFIVSMFGEEEEPSRIPSVEPPPPPPLSAASTESVEYGPELEPQNVKEPEPQNKKDLRSGYYTRSRRDNKANLLIRCDCGSTLNGKPVYFTHGCCSRCNKIYRTPIKYLICDECDSEYCSYCLEH